MSIKWMSYFWERTDYKEGELLTALALADFADDNGFCFPFMEQLAKKARIGVRQVQKILRNFEDDGLLEITRFQGRGKRTQFQLKKVNSTTPFTDRKKVNCKTPIQEIKGELYDIKKVNSTTFPIYKDEPSLEPSECEDTHDLSEAVSAVVEIFEITPAIHSQNAIDASDISELGLWRKVLTEKKASCGAEWNNHNFRQKQIGYCLSNYRTAFEKLPPKTKAEDLFFNPATFQLKSYRPAHLGGGN